MTDGNVRRKQLMQILHDSHEPVSGTSLAKSLNVSRQVIVQDIALLRAVNQDILATTKGYVLYTTSESPVFHRSFCVNHDDTAIQDELNTMVDYGGKVLDVMIEHDVYGQISANLMLENRKDIEHFCTLLKQAKAKPLNIIAGGMHYHTVEARSEAILDRIETALREKGYLVTA